MELMPMCLRLERSDGTPAEEYRIFDGAIECRQIEDSCDWHRLSAEQLTDHVNRKTVVANWLTHRLGWRRLLRACVADQHLQMFGPLGDDVRRIDCPRFSAPF